MEVEDYYSNFYKPFYRDKKAAYEFESFEVKQSGDVEVEGVKEITFEVYGKRNLLYITSFLANKKDSVFIYNLP